MNRNSQHIFESARWAAADSRSFSYHSCQRQDGSEQHSVAFSIDGKVAEIVGPFGSYSSACRWVRVAGVIDHIGNR